MAPLLALGCDGDDASDGDTDQAQEEESGGEDDESSTTDESATAGETETGEDESDCAGEMRDDEFAIGLNKSSEMVQATFISANPAPPFKGDNIWVLEFADMDGAPLDALDMVVVPTMPDHGHGTPVNTIVTKLDNPGQYELADVNLFMTGYWEVDIELTLPGGEVDNLMFAFCVE